MPTVISCPYCASKVSVPSNLTGEINCPKCIGVIQAPAPTTARVYEPVRTGEPGSGAMLCAGAAGVGCLVMIAASLARPGQGTAGLILFSLVLTLILSITAFVKGLRWAFEQADYRGAGAPASASFAFNSQAGLHSPPFTSRGSRRACRLPCH
jgi:hypothetical protein